MGNPRFKLSNMMPNGWFNKHIGMNKPKTVQREPQEKINPQEAPQAFTQNRASYYIPSGSPLHPKALDTHFPSDPPREPTRKPPRKIPTTPKLISSHSEYAKDFILELPPIATKPPNREESKKKQQRHRQQETKLINYNCKKIRMRVHSPKVKVFNQRLIKHNKGTPPPTLSESFVVIKISRDPRKDFRESMLEMIRENELRGSKDLEELLACYLCLNSTDYHDVIVNVFEEIWFDINVIRRL